MKKIQDFIAKLCNFSLFCLLAANSGPLWAFALQDIELLETSSTKKSIVIDRGNLEEFSDGLKASFFVQSGDKNFPKVFIVAEGTLIKALPKKSFWYLNVVHLPALIEKGEHLLILTTQDVTKGRTSRIKKRHVVVSPDQYETTEEYLKKNSLNVPDRMLKDANLYEATSELYETKKIPEADIEVETYEQIKKRGGTHFSEDYKDFYQEKFFVGSKEVNIGDVQNAEDKKILDSMSLGLVEKINSQKFGLTNGLYRNQKKDAGSHEMNSMITMNSVKEDLFDEKSKRETKSLGLLAKQKRDGEAWSEDMDDATLRRYFISTGLELEERRRAQVMNELEGHEILFHYSGSMTDHTTDVDQNYRTLGYSLGIGYDFHLSKTSLNISNWSIQFLMELGVTDYDIGGQNARGQEGSYGVYGNYYFYNNPLTLNSFIGLVGAGVKVGSAKMKSIELANASQSYTYQTMSLPAFQLITKYRFRSGDLTEETANVGASLNGGIMWDMKRLSVIEAHDDNILGKISVNDIKFLVGMSVYF